VRQSQDAAKKKKINVEHVDSEIDWGPVKGGKGKYLERHKAGRKQKQSSGAIVFENHLGGPQVHEMKELTLIKNRRWTTAG